MFGMPQHWHQSSFQKLGALAYCLTQNVADHNYELSPVVSLNPPPSDQGTNLSTNGGFQLKLRLQSCQIFMLIFVPVF